MVGCGADIAVAAVQAKGALMTVRAGVGFDGGASHGGDGADVPSVCAHRRAEDVCL